MVSRNLRFDTRCDGRSKEDALPSAICTAAPGIRLGLGAESSSANVLMYTTDVTRFVVADVVSAVRRIQRRRHRRGGVSDVEARDVVGASAHHGDLTHSHRLDILPGHSAGAVETGQSQGNAHPTTLVEPFDMPLSGDRRREWRERDVDGSRFVEPLAPAIGIEERDRLLDKPPDPVGAGGVDEEASRPVLARRSWPRARL